MSIILVIIVLIGLFILGISLWKTSRIVSLLLITPVLAIFLFVGYVFYNPWYHTAPDFLDFTAQKEKNHTQ